MDIGALKAQDTGEVVIKDNAGDDTDIVIVVAGPSHPTRVAYERAKSSALLKEFNRRGKARISENPDILFDEETERLVALTINWRNIEADGTPLEFSRDAARALYENRGLSIREQVAAGLANREVFTRSSATT